jgi:ubiquinone/menaquinone biosynthesis C-methylase UbiE
MLLKIGQTNELFRIKWLEETLKKIPAGARILDAGAGELAQRKFCSHLNYVSQDFSLYSGVGDGKGLQTGTWDQSKLDIISDITAIPQPDGSFDAIMCIEVFEHIPNPIMAIKEFSRLLKPGGILIITAPNTSLTHFAPYHFYSGFNKYFYEMFLNQNNFEIIEIVANGNYYEYMAQEIWRIPDIAQKYSGSKKNIFQKLILFLVVFLLNRYNKQDKGSGELLCFGYNILARKKRNDSCSS